MVLGGIIPRQREFSGIHLNCKMSCDRFSPNHNTFNKSEVYYTLHTLVKLAHPQQGTRPYCRVPVSYLRLNVTDKDIDIVSIRNKDLSKYIPNLS